MKRSAIIASVLIATLGSCTADLNEANLCYGIAKALCLSFKVEPVSRCRTYFQEYCQSDSFGSGETSTEDCVDVLKKQAGDDYSKCPPRVPYECADMFYTLDRDYCDPYDYNGEYNPSQCNSSSDDDDDYGDPMFSFGCPR